MSVELRRGDVVIADLDPVKGSEQGDRRPALVIQNDIGNRNASTTIVAAITSSSDRDYPFTVDVAAGEANLDRDSTILLNQIRTVSISERVETKIGELTGETMDAVDDAIKVSLALD